MSKCYTNWQRLPNSRMDRQHKPKSYLRHKEAADKTEPRVLRKLYAKSGKN